MKQPLRKGIVLLLLLCCFCFGASAQNLSVERQVYNFLTQEMGFPSASACGVLANIEEESAFNVNNLGDYGTSYGLCQWHAGRYTSLKTYCLGKGLDHQTAEGQLAYLKFELEIKYPELLTLLRVLEDSPNGAYQAAYLWCIEFERPSDMENKAVSRGTLAKGKYWNRYNSFVMVEQEAQQPMTREEAVRSVQQTQVVIPQPPEEIVAEPNLQMEAADEITEWIEPVLPEVFVQQPKEEWHGNPSTGFAAAIVFMPLSDGRKERFQLQPPVEKPLQV